MSKKTNLKMNAKAIINVGPLLSLIALCLALILLTDKFLTVTNISNVIKQISVYAVLGVGMTFCFIGGGIDLSVGSQLGLYAVVSSMVAVETGSVFLAILVMLVLSVIIGCYQGLMISKFKLEPFIITLAGMMIFRGFIMVLTNGNPVTGIPDALRWVGIGDVFGLPAPIFTCIVLFVVGTIILKKTRLGRYISAMGSNEAATKITGIKVDRYKTILYIFTSVNAAIASLILTGRLGTALSSGGDGYELQAIAATIVGGASMKGGEGNLFGTFIGACIMGVIRNGLNLLQVQAAWQNITVGVVIVLAVIIDQHRVKQKV